MSKRVLRIVTPEPERGSDIPLSNGMRFGFTGLTEFHSFDLDVTREMGDENEEVEVVTIYVGGRTS